MQPRSESRDRRSRSPKTTPHSGARQRSRSPRPNLRDTRSLVEPAHLGDLVLQDIQDSLEASNNRLKNEARYLRRHLGLPTSPGQSAEEISGPAPLFFVEITPYSNKGGAKCKLPGCSELIRQGKYRLALCPGMDPLSSRYGKQSTDFYHINCFERIADFTSSDFSKRVVAVTRKHYADRGLKGNQIRDGNYLCDGGAEKLIVDWKWERARLLNARDGVQESRDQDPRASALENLIHNAGSKDFVEQPIPGITDHERFLLLHDLAPWESDGADDQDEWNILEQYLHVGSDDDRHTLSLTLLAWEQDKVLTTSSDSILTDKGKELKAELSEKATRAIKRLSAVPMPDFHSAFFGS